MTPKGAQTRKRKLSDSAPEATTPKSQQKGKSPQKVLTPKNGSMTPQGKTTPKQKGTPKNSAQKTPSSNGKQTKAKAKKLTNDDEEEEEKTPVSPPMKKVKVNNEVELKKQSPGSTKKSVKSDDLDVRTLFVKNLPKDCSIKQLKALSNDIKQVRLRAKTTFNSKSKKKERSGFAYLEFENEAAAERNSEVLKSSFIDGQNLIVDFVGKKSTNGFDRKKIEVGEHDQRKLYVAGLAEDVVESDLRKLFLPATNIVVPRTKKSGTHFGYAFIQFDSDKQAKIFHDKMQDKSLKGNVLVVLYAKKMQRAENKKLKQEKKAKKAKAKKQSTVESSMDVDEEANEAEDDEDKEQDDEDKGEDDEEESGDEEESDGDEEDE